MDSPSTNSPLLRAEKRKASSSGQQAQKKLRLSPPPAEVHSDVSGASDSEDDNALSDAELAFSVAPTPLSLVSASQSPKQKSTPRAKNHFCQYEGCTRAFNRPAHLKDHMLSHTNTRLHVCPHPPCTKDFLRQSHLKHHVKSAHSNVRDHACHWEGCGKRFVTSTRLKKHMLGHEKNERFKCNFHGCGQLFRKHATLGRHFTAVHEGKKPFVCDVVKGDVDICGARFDNAYKLKTHRIRDHGSKRFECTICSGGELQREGDDDSVVTFSTFAEFQSHNKTVHPPTCTKCGIEFNTPKELDNHYDIRHGEQDLADRQKHVCPKPDCGRGFTSKGGLKTHICTVHEGQRPFVCGVVELSSMPRVSGWDGENACGRGFGTKSILQEHIRAAHMEIGPSWPLKGSAKLKDRQTRKKSSAIGLLTGTAYDEEPDRNIPCLIRDCRYRFILDWNLEVHLQSMHGLSEYEVDRLLARRDAQGSQSHESGSLSRDAMDASPEFDDQFATSLTTSLGAYAQTYWGMEIEASAMRGGDFWVGGNYGEPGRNEKDQDETQTSGLLEFINRSEHDGESSMPIDPKLL